MKRVEIAIVLTLLLFLFSGYIQTETGGEQNAKTANATGNPSVPPKPDVNAILQRKAYLLERN